MQPSPAPGSDAPGLLTGKSHQVRRAMQDIFLGENCFSGQQQEQGGNKIANNPLVPKAHCLL